MFININKKMKRDFVAYILFSILFKFIQCNSINKYALLMPNVRPNRVNIS